MNISNHRVELGDRAKDKITGLTGIVVATTTWLNGCVRIAIQAEEVKDGKTPHAEHFDVEQVEVIDKCVHRPKQIAMEPDQQPAAPVTTGGPDRERPNAERLR